MTGQVEVALFGTPQLRLSEGRTHALERRDAAILAYLALEGTTTRNRLVELLWPDSEPEAARNTLRQRLFQLKKRAGREVVSGAESLVPATNVVMLAVDDNRDASLLDGHDFSDCPVFDEWLKKQRNRLSNRRRESLIALADDAENAGRLPEALAIAEELVALEPLHEDAHRRLMRLHYLRRDRAAALQAFDRCERILKDELSARPDKETLALLAHVEKAEIARANVGRSVPPTVLHPPILIGRACEWQALCEAWDASQSIIMTGAAGLGKSRLLSDFSRSRGKTGVLTVSARPGDERLPHAVLSRLLRGLLELRKGDLLPGVKEELARVLPELGASPTGAINTARFVNAVESVVEQTIAADLAAIVLDDLHFMDDASLETVQHLVARAGMRWIVAFREGELSAGGNSFVDALHRSSASRAIALSPLTSAEVSELVDSLGIEEIDSGKWGKALHKRTGGNPLFLLETIKSMLTGTTESALVSSSSLPVGTHIGALVERRITRLSPDAIRLARCAAVAGQDFSAELAAHVLKAAPLDLADGWAELEAAQVLHDGAFTHDLIYEAALSSVPAPIAQQLHAEITRFLQQHGAPHVRLAEHAQAGKLWAIAAPAWMSAGLAAESSGRLLDSVHSYQQARACYLSLSDEAAAFDACLRIVEARINYACDEGARAAIEELLAMAGGPTQRLMAIQKQMYFMGRRGEYRQLIELGQSILSELSQAEPTTQLGITCDLSHALSVTGEHDRALATLKPSEVWVMHSGTLEQRWSYCAYLARALTLSGRFSEAIPTFQSAIEFARQDKRPCEVSELLILLGDVYYRKGGVQQALTLTVQASAMLAELAGDSRSTYSSNGDYFRALSLCDLGRYAEAISFAEQARAEFQHAKLGDLTARCDLILANVFTHIAQYSRSLQVMKRSAVDPKRPRTQLLALAVRVDTAIANQAPDLQKYAHEIEAFAKSLSDPALLHEATLLTARLAEPARALQLLAPIVKWFVDTGRDGLALSAHIRACEAAYSLGWFDAASEHAEAALRLAKTVHAPVQYRAELWLHTHRAFVAAKDPTALQVLHDGLDWMRVTLTHVPIEFRDSFLNRNLTNRELIRIARREGVALT